MKKLLISVLLLTLTVASYAQLSPELKACSGPYYRWEDVKEYISKK